MGIFDDLDFTKSPKKKGIFDDLDFSKKDDEPKYPGKVTTEIDTAYMESRPKTDEPYKAAKEEPADSIFADLDFSKPEATPSISPEEFNQFIPKPQVAIAPQVVETPAPVADYGRTLQAQKFAGIDPLARKPRGASGTWAEGTTTPEPTTEERLASRKIDEAVDRQTGDGKGIIGSTIESIGKLETAFRNSAKRVGKGLITAASIASTEAKPMYGDMPETEGEKQKQAILKESLPGILEEIDKIKMFKPSELQKQTEVEDMADFKTFMANPTDIKNIPIGAILRVSAGSSANMAASILNPVAGYAVNFSQMQAETAQQMRQLGITDADIIKSYSSMSAAPQAAVETVTDLFLLGKHIPGVKQISKKIASKMASPIMKKLQSLGADVTALASEGGEEVLQNKIDEVFVATAVKAQRDKLIKANLPTTDIDSKYAQYLENKKDELSDAATFALGALAAVPIRGGVRVLETISNRAEKADQKKLELQEVKQPEIVTPSPDVLTNEPQQQPAKKAEATGAPGVETPTVLAEKKSWIDLRLETPSDFWKMSEPDRTRLAELLDDKSIELMNALKPANLEPLKTTIEAVSAPEQPQDTKEAVSVPIPNAETTSDVKATKPEKVKPTITDNSEFVKMDDGSKLVSEINLTIDGYQVKQSDYSGNKITEVLKINDDGTTTKETDQGKVYEVTQKVAAYKKENKINLVDAMTFKRQAKDKKVEKADLPRVETVTETVTEQTPAVPETQDQAIIGEKTTQSDEISTVKPMSKKLNKFREDAPAPKVKAPVERKPIGTDVLNPFSAEKMPTIKGEAFKEEELKPLVARRETIVNSTTNADNKEPQELTKLIREADSILSRVTDAKLRNARVRLSTALALKGFDLTGKPIRPENLRSAKIRARADEIVERRRQKVESNESEAKWDIVKRANPRSVLDVEENVIDDKGASGKRASVVQRFGVKTFENMDKDYNIPGRIDIDQLVKAFESERVDTEGRSALLDMDVGEFIRDGMDFDLLQKNEGKESQAWALREAREEIKQEEDAAKQTEPEFGYDAPYSEYLGYRKEAKKAGNKEEQDYLDKTYPKYYDRMIKDYGSEAGFSRRIDEQNDILKRSEPQRIGRGLDDAPLLSAVQKLSKALSNSMAAIRQPIKGDAITIVPNSSDTNSYVNALEKVFPRLKVVTFKAHKDVDRVQRPNGIYYEGVIFVNENNPDKLSFTIGHEIGHRLFKNHPELKKIWNRYVKKNITAKGNRNLQNIIRTETALREDMSERAIDALSREEVLADLSGTFWSDPDFLMDLEAQNKPLFNKVMREIIETLTKLINSLTGKERQHNDVLKDMKEARRVFAKIVYEASKKEGGDITRVVAQNALLFSRVNDMFQTSMFGKDKPDLFTAPETIKAREEQKPVVPKKGEQIDAFDGGNETQRQIEEFKRTKAEQEAATRKDEKDLPMFNNNETARAADAQQALFSRSDDTYLKAVESGDMETAQKMVDEAAKKAGSLYDNTRSKVSDLFSNRGTVMEDRVSRRIHDSKIIDPIVDSIPIQMVDMFGGRKGTLDVLLNNPSMFQDALTKTIQDGFIGKLSSSGLRDKAISIAAGARTELGLVSPAPFNREMFSTIYALQNNLVSTMGNKQSISSSSSDNAIGTKTIGTRNVKADNRTKPSSPILGITGEFIKLNSADFTNTLYLHAKEYIKKIAEDQVLFDPVTYDDNGKVIPLSQRFTDSPDIRFSRSETPFYSALSRAFESAKQTAMPAQQWSQWLDGNAPKMGVKKDEIEWSGIKDFLNLKGKEKLSKEDIVSYLDQNGVKVTEVEKNNEVRNYRLDEIQYMGIENRGVDFHIIKVPGNELQFPVSTYPTKESAINRALEKTTGNNNYTKFETYQLPGGTNYKEILLTLPVKNTLITRYQWYALKGYSEADRENMSEEENKRLWKEFIAFGKEQNDRQPGVFRYTHFDEKNILAHVRINERTDTDGNKVLFVEELQSDWAQKGRKDGFNIPVKWVKHWSNPDGEVAEINNEGEGQIILLPDGKDWKLVKSGTGETQYFDTKEQAKEQAQKEFAGLSTSGTPVAPFVTDTKSWTALALKRILRYAVDNGFSSVAWTNGEQQADRYNLAKQIDEVIAIKKDDNTYDVRVTKESREILSDNYKAEDLEDVLGKELAKKIITGENAKETTSYTAKANGEVSIAKYSGLDLKVGGEGMVAFYDNIVPQVANDVMKKIGGGKVEQIDVDGLGKQQGITITPEMSGKISEGLPLFSRASDEMFDTADKIDELKAKQADRRTLVTSARTTGDGRNVTQVVAAQRKRMDAEIDALRAKLGRLIDEVADEVFGRTTPRFSRAETEFKAVDTKSSKFLSWFGDSKVVDESGKPLVVYHGSGKSEKFYEFKPTISSRGTYFGANRKVVSPSYFFSSSITMARSFGEDRSEYRGDSWIHKVYLSIKNPLDLTSSNATKIAEKLNLVDRNGAFLGKANLWEAFDIQENVDKVIAAGYDGAIISESNAARAFGETKDTKAKRTYVAFSPTQIKSAISNTGEFSSTNPDIRYSRLSPEMAEELYGKIADKTNREGLLKRLRRNDKSWGGALKEFMGDILTPISTRISKLSPSVTTRLRKFEYDIGQADLKDIKTALPWLEKFEKMSKVDQAVYDIALKNEDFKKVTELNSKYDMAGEWANVRELLDDIYVRLFNTGFDLGHIGEYFPRKIMDADGLLTELGSDEVTQGMIADEIAYREELYGRPLTVHEMAQAANHVISRSEKMIRTDGSMKARKIAIDEKIDKYYDFSPSAILSYIGNMNKMIEMKKLADEVRPEETNKNQQTLAPVLEMEVAEGDPNSINLDETIGNYIAKLIREKKLKPEQQEELVGLLKARFNYKPTDKVVQTIKNIGYLTSMGSGFSSFITQIGDLAWAYYNSPKYATKALGQALARTLSGGKLSNNTITKEDLGIERMGEEFKTVGGLSKAVNKVFKYTFLSAMDNVGKETLINSAFDKYQAQAKKNDPALMAEIERIFGDEAEQVVADLKAGDKNSDNVKFLLFNKLLNFQPISMTEMPKNYLTSPRGRIFYALKTFTIKQLDVFRREGIDAIANAKTPAEKAKAVRNLMLLAALVIMANGTADEAKDWLFRRKTTLSDKVIDNLLRLVGVSRYTVWEARRNGLSSAMFNLVKPPLNVIELPLRDIGKAYKDIDDGEPVDFKNFESWGMVPFFGKHYDWWFGAASQRQIKKQEKNSPYSKAIKDARKKYKEYSALMKDKKYEEAKQFRAENPEVDAYSAPIKKVPGIKADVKKFFRDGQKIHKEITDLRTEIEDATDEAVKAKKKQRLEELQMEFVTKYNEAMQQAKNNKE